MRNISLMQIVTRAIVLFTAIPIHESAHAYVADKMGDPTAKQMGRLSLNPLVHFDPVGCLAMLVLGIGWAKPVPVNRYNFYDRKKGMALSAARGPASNLCVALASLVLAKLSMYGYIAVYGTALSSVLLILFQVLSMMCSINISLAIFNLLPFPPFDGSRIFNYFLSDRAYFKIMEYERYIFLIVFALLWLGVLDTPLSLLNNGVYFVLDKLTMIIDVIFRAILG